MAMACSDVYPAGSRDHVTEVNDEMLSELAGRTCPRCGCHESRPVDSADDREMARLPLRVCVACNEVFGYDDSTSVPEHLHLHDEEDSSFGGRIWKDDDDVDPRRSSPCFRNSGSEDRDNDERHSEYRDPPGRGRGRGGGRGHHHGEDRPHHRHQRRHHHQHQGAGRGHQRQRGETGGRGSADESSSSGRDWWNQDQVACTCLQSGKRALKGAACSLLTGDYGGAVGSVSNEMEPVGRAVGSALGSVAGNVIGSPRAGEIAADMGAMVGSGVAEMLNDSNLCNRRTSSHHD